MPSSLTVAAPVAQLDRASGFEPEGRGFESLRARQSFRISAAVQHRPWNGHLEIRLDKLNLHRGGRHILHDVCWHLRQGERWPGVDAPRQRWYLASSGADGQLQARSPRRASREFAVDYELGPPDAFAFWVQSQHGRGLSFTSAPLAQDQELAGFPLVRLRVASNDPEPLLFAYLEQISADGSADVLAFGRLAASYRKTGTAPYDTLGLPWITGLSADHAPLAPGREVDLDFALTPVSRVISAGSRLRVVVTGADPRQRNLADLRKDPAPRISVVSGRNGSWIELPLRPLSPANGT